MHRPLLIPELVQIIADWIGFIHESSPEDVDEYDDEDTDMMGNYVERHRFSHPVLSLGLTCRTFYEPAMNVLWRKLRSIAPLFKCFPPSIWRQDIGGRLVFMKAPSVPDWNRFILHAARVRMLTIEDCSTVGVEEFRIMSVFRPTLLLFPLLENLEWGKRAQDLALFTRLFIGPQLATIWTYNFSSYDAVHTIEALRDLSPALQTLALLHLDPENSAAVDKALCNAVPSLQSLTTLVCNPEREFGISDSTIIRLARLPHLRYLRCRASPAKEVAEYLRTSGHPVFPAMRQCGFSSVNLTEAISDLLRVIESPYLTEVHMSLAKHPTAELLQGCFEATATHADLEDFDVVVTSRHSLQVPDENIVTEDHLRPLFSLNRLHRVALSSIWFDLDSHSIASIATAWPHIRGLYLGRSSSRTHLILKDLIPLAVNCRELAYLTLPIDASRAVGPIIHFGEQHGNHDLRWLAVGRSRIENPVAVAAFLADLFPLVNVVSDWNTSVDASPEDKVMSQRWRQVKELIARAR